MWHGGPWRTASPGPAAARREPASTTGLESVAPKPKTSQPAPEHPTYLGRWGAGAPRAGGCIERLRLVSAEEPLLIPMLRLATARERILKPRQRRAHALDGHGQVVHDELRRQAEHAVACASELFVTASIELAAEFVVSSVNFHDQAGRWRAEVDDEEAPVKTGKRK